MNGPRSGVRVSVSSAIFPSRLTHPGLPSTLDYESMPDELLVFGLCQIMITRVS